MDLEKGPYKYVRTIFEMTGRSWVLFYPPPYLIIFLTILVNLDGEAFLSRQWSDHGPFSFTNRSSNFLEFTWLSFTASSIVCLHSIHSYLALLLIWTFIFKFSWPPYQSYSVTFTTKDQGSQACTTSGWVLDSCWRLRLMHEFWIVPIFTLGTRTMVLESPSSDCVSSYIHYSPAGLVSYLQTSVVVPWKYFHSRWTISCRMGGTKSLALDSNGHCRF